MQRPGGAGRRARLFGQRRGAGTISEAALLAEREAAHPRPATRRIVSTYLGADELIAELADPARVAGVSVYADDRGTSNCLGQFPPRVARLRSDPEAVFALEPDLICMAGFTESDSLRLIESAGVPVVYWSRFDSFADVLDQLALYGAALGEEGRAGTIAAAVRGRLADLDARLRGARPVRTLYFDPPAFTMGRGTLVDEILVRAGAINVVDELGLSGPSQIDLETILALAPEVILLPSYAENGSALRALAAAPIGVRFPPPAPAGSTRFRAPGLPRFPTMPRGAWNGSRSSCTRRRSPGSPTAATDGSGGVQTK